MNCKKYKSLLIIGGTGFFGQSILDYFDRNFFLNKKINKIIILSRKSNKIKIKKNIRNNFLVLKVNKNILNAKIIPYADYVFYCAILKNYKDDHKAVKNYYNLAKKYHRKSKILYMSSGAVYGQQPQYLRNIKESYIFKNKRLSFKNKKKNMYSIIKLKNEALFMKLANLKIKVSLARCFTFVGKFLPRRSNYVIGNFIQSILDNQPLQVNANYKVIRSYMHTDDLVRWLLKIVSKANFSCPVYNVGSDQGINVRKLGLYLAKKYKLVYKFTKTKSSFADIYLPSVNKAKKELKLKLNYNNFESVDDIIKSLKDRIY